MAKKKVFHNCTIMRIKKITSFKWNMITGEKSDETSRVVTEPCGTPLFGDRERETGVCNSCHKGWTTEGNTFADQNEYDYAITARAL